MTRWTEDPVRANALQWDGRTPCHHEAFDLSVVDPKGMGGWWFRYTVDAPIEGEARSTLWGAHFSRERAEDRFALRTEFPVRSFAQQSDGFHIRVSQAELSRRNAKGGLRNPKDPDQSLRWNLHFEDQEEPVQLYTKRRMYKRSWPPTRMLLPMSGARAHGIIQVGEERIQLSDARAHQSHLWGTRHHDHWSWGLATGFREAPEARLAALEAVPRVGGRGFTLLHLRDADGGSLVFDEFERKRELEDGHKPGVWSFEAKGGRYTLSGRISASLQKMAGMTLDDPEGTRRFLHHSAVADATVELWRRSLGKKTLERTLTAKGTAVLQQGAQRPFEDVTFYI